jgi:hypothetical protein
MECFLLNVNIANKGKVRAKFSLCLTKQHAIKRMGK